MSRVDETIEYSWAIERRDLMLWCGVFAVMLALHLEAIGFGTSALFGFVAIGLGLLGLVLIVSGAWARQPSRLLRGAGILLAFAIAMLSGNSIQDAQVRTSRERGDRVSDALAAYHAREGTYPDALEALVPRDLAALPPTTMGLFHTRRFEYQHQRDVDDYRLDFAAPACTGWWRGAHPRWSWYD